MYKEIVNNKSNKFYTVNEQMIVKAQDELGIIFPNELVDFYNEVGYGFLASKVDNFNRIMDPNSICEFRFRNGQFENYTELSIYDDYEKDKLVFFEICEGCYLSMGFSKKNIGNIYDGNKKISDNLKQFLIDYQNDEMFFLK